MKKLLLALLLPISFSAHAVSPLSIAKLGGAAVAGAVAVYSGSVAKDAYGNGKRPSDIWFAAPWAMTSVGAGLLATFALKSALDIDVDFKLKSIRIK